MCSIILWKDGNIEGICCYCMIENVEIFPSQKSVIVLYVCRLKGYMNFIIYQLFTLLQDNTNE
jgi:hypothetical protein